MDSYIILGVGAILAVFGGGVIAYLKLLKKRLRRYVLRYEKIEKYFEEEKGRKPGKSG